MNGTQCDGLTVRVRAGYAAMAAFEDTPDREIKLLVGCTTDEQFDLDLVAWYIERLGRMGRPVDAAWLLHEFLFWRDHTVESGCGVDDFIHEIVLGDFASYMRDEVEHDHGARREFERITATFDGLLEGAPNHRRRPAHPTPPAWVRPDGW